MTVDPGDLGCAHHPIYKAYSAELRDCVKTDFHHCPMPTARVIAIPFLVNTDKSQKRVAGCTGLWRYGAYELSLTWFKLC
jgi:hypothetical protein